MDGFKMLSQFWHVLRRHRRERMEIRRVANSNRNTLLATRLEVANTGELRRKGLLGRTRLAAGDGLWIVPCESVHTFFMRFPIDLIYLDRDHQVRKLRHEVVPWRMSACLSAHSVLELPPGSIRDSKTEVGDRLIFSEGPITTDCPAADVHKEDPLV
ncbi:MAG TPA: DUF192 domain-containing protein [Terracidiphilus sp.]|jgi:hypothetical protein